MIYTFYSYKGGVGRTMALANVAELFYQAGLRVLMIDWDLEAPGLERFFPLNLEEILDRPGVMDMLLEYKKQMAKELPTAEQQKALPFDTPDQFTIDVYPGTDRKGRLWLLSAGRRSEAHFAEYAYNVRTFDWRDFYQNWEGELYFEWLREQFEQIADVVLIDSRTGVTEIGGVCTYQFADIIVMLCTASKQSLDGTYKMTRNFRDPIVQDLRHGRPLEVVVVPARVERSVDKQLDLFQDEFIGLFKDLVPRSGSIDVQELWRLGIPYIPKYAFEETLAVRRSARASSQDIAEAFFRLGQTMRRLANADKLPQDLLRRDLTLQPESRLQYPGREIGLPHDLYRRLSTTLVQLPEMQSDQALRTVFVTEELVPFRAGLPTAETPRQLVDMVLAYLVEKRLADGQPVLPLFLRAVRDRYLPQDVLYSEMDWLIEAVQAAAVAERSTSTLPQHLQLVLKLFGTSRSQEHRDSIVLSRGDSKYPITRVFGLALENTTESAPAKGVFIRVEFWWEGDMPQKAPSFQSPPHGKWTPRFVNLFGEREAVLSFKDPGLVCIHKHPEEWNGFKLTLPEPLRGHFLITYTISTVDPITESHGELRIVIEDDTPGS